MKIFDYPVSRDIDTTCIQHKAIKVCSNEVEKIVDIISQEKIEIICINGTDDFTNRNLAFLLNLKNIWGG